jgi:putative membrane protein
LENAALVSLIPIPVTLLFVCVTVLYLRGWLRLRATFPQLVSRGRVAAFLAGIFCAWLALASPLATLDHQLLSIHMIQHLLLMTGAASLILMGEPATVFLRVLPESFVGRVAGYTAARTWSAWLGKIPSSSVFCWFVGTITVIAWHIPAAFALGHHSVWWHELEQASFLLGGMLFWWPVIRPWPSAAREPRWSVPLYLFLATLPCDALSAYLVFCDHVVYRPYLSVPRLLNLSALHDQQWAGALMWVAVTLIYVVPAVAITVRLLSAGHERAPAFESALDRVPEAT